MDLKSQSFLTTTIQNVWFSSQLSLGIQPPENMMIQWSSSENMMIDA